MKSYFSNVVGLEIKLASEFSWQDLAENKIDVLLRQNAPALLLSYARPIISSITSASKFPTYNIPFLDFSSEVVDAMNLNGEE